MIDRLMEYAVILVGSAVMLACAYAFAVLVMI